MPASPQFPQIPLPLGAGNRLTFDLYRAGGNAAVVAELQCVAAGVVARNVYLWGKAGTGKTHLLHATCHRAADAGRRAALIPLGRRTGLQPVLLDSLEHLDLVCIDDLDAVAGQPAWELALFDLFNRMRDARRPLVLTAHASPGGCGVALTDLKSRLAWDLVYRLAPLDENERFAALRQRAQQRGIEIPDEVLGFLSRRISRDMHSLFAWLERLDRESLAAGKRLTIPFVRELMETGQDTAADSLPGRP